VISQLLGHARVEERDEARLHLDPAPGKEQPAAQRPARVGAIAEKKKSGHGARFRH
jgi:hypothetical protein